MLNWCKIVSSCIGILLIGFQLSYATPLAEPQVTAKAAIVMEATTGKILFAKNAEEIRYPASTTKIMTLLVALEKGNLDDNVIASQKASETDGSSLWLSPGEQMNMLDLMYGMMLISGNDATVALAEHIAGSVERYADLMNSKAREIGAENTRFTNTSGLPDPNHYTTAHDLAKIAAYGYKNPVFTKIVSTERKMIPWAGKSYDRDLYNENKMLWNYDGANGVKTGYTEAAGPSLVSSAKRGNIQLIAVVLDSDRMWLDSKALLDYGFSKIEPKLVYKQGEIIKSIRIKDGVEETVQLTLAEDIVFPVSFGDRQDFGTVVETPQNYSAPVNAGQSVGSVKLLYKGQVYGSVDLIAMQTIERKSLFGKLWTSLWNAVTFVMQKFA